MRLTVLGAGTCILLPNRAPSGYWVDAGDLRIRLDCGPGSVAAMGRFGLPWGTLTHQIVTHFHLDHVNDLPTLFFALKYGRAERRKAPFTVVGPKGIEAMMHGFVGLYRMRLLDQEFPVRFKEVVPPAKLGLGKGVRLQVIKAPHTWESIAVRLDADGRSLGYTGDTTPSDELARLFEGVDLLISECSFVDENHGTRHMVADEVADLASACRAKHLMATHSYFDPEAERLSERLARRYSGRITVPRDGLSIEIGSAGGSLRRGEKGPPPSKTPARVLSGPTKRRR